MKLKKIQQITPKQRINKLQVKKKKFQIPKGKVLIKEQTNTRIVVKPYG